MRNQGVEGNFWLGTEAGYLGAYGFPGAVVATDGAVQNGRMGAGFTSLSWQPIGKQWEELPEAEVAGVSPITNSLAGLEMSQGRSPSWAARYQLEQMGAEDGDLVQHEGRTFQISKGQRTGHIRVGREEEGTSSLRPELAAIEAALQSIHSAADLLILSDSQTALNRIREWVGEGLRPCMELIPDADILRSVLARLSERIEKGAATLLVKIKAHRGEPLNEAADDEAGRGCGLGPDQKRWDDSTSRATFTWKSEQGITRRAPWGLSVRTAINKKAGWARVAAERRAGFRSWKVAWWDHSNLNGRAPNAAGRQHIERHWWDDTRTWEEAGAALRHQENSWRLELDTLIQDARRRGESLKDFSERIVERYDKDQADSMICLAETELQSDGLLHSQPPRGKPTTAGWQGRACTQDVDSGLPSQTPAKSTSATRVVAQLKHPLPKTSSTHPDGHKLLPVRGFPMQNRKACVE